MPDAGRVVTGSAKGLRLDAPGEGTRPLADKLKQGLFASLEAEGVLSEEGAFLDLFAGSGAAGIEALSRGLRRAVFVESDRRACRVIEGNLRRAGLAGGTVVRADVLRFLRSDAGAAGAPFDACLVDPPYAQPLLGPALELLADSSRGWLGQRSRVVAKHHWRSPPDERLAGLCLARRRRYGDSALSFYAQDGENDVQEEG